MRLVIPRMFKVITLFVYWYFGNCFNTSKAWKFRKVSNAVEGVKDVSKTNKFSTILEYILHPSGFLFEIWNITILINRRRTIVLYFHMFLKETQVPFYKSKLCVHEHVLLWAYPVDTDLLRNIMNIPMVMSITILVYIYRYSFKNTNTFIYFTH